MFWVAGIVTYVAAAAAFYHYIAVKAQPDPDDQYLSPGICWVEEPRKAA